MNRTEKAAVRFAAEQRLKRWNNSDVSYQVPKRPFYLISAATGYQALTIANVMGAGSWWGFVPVQSFTFSGVRDQLRGVGIVKTALIGLFSDAERDYLQNWG